MLSMKYYLISPQQAFSILLVEYTLTTAHSTSLKCQCAQKRQNFKKRLSCKTYIPRIKINLSQVDESRTSYCHLFNVKIVSGSRSENLYFPAGLDKTSYIL